MVNIPMLNRDSEWLKQRIDEWSSQPEMQKRLVLIVVSVALLLDNMLYMVENKVKKFDLKFSKKSRLLSQLFQNI